MQITKVKNENDLFDFSKIRERLVMTCVPADNEYVKHGATTRIIGDIAIVYRIIIEAKDRRKVLVRQYILLFQRLRSSSLLLRRRFWGKYELAYNLYLSSTSCDIILE